MIEGSFQDLSKSAFIPLHWTWVRPHLAYSMLAHSPNFVSGISHPEPTLEERIGFFGKRLLDLVWLEVASHLHM